MINLATHCSDVIMTTMASQITSLTIVYSIVYSDAVYLIVYSDADKKHQSSASLAFVRGIHRWSVDSPHKGTLTRKMFPFYDVIMSSLNVTRHCWITFNIMSLACLFSTVQTEREWRAHIHNNFSWAVLYVEKSKALDDMISNVTHRRT